MASEIKGKREPLAPSKIDKIKSLLAQGTPPNKVAQEVAVSISFVYKIRAQLGIGVSSVSGNSKRRSSASEHDSFERTFHEESLFKSLLPKYATALRAALFLKRRDKILLDSGSGLTIAAQVIAAIAATYPDKAHYIVMTHNQGAFRVLVPDKPGVPCVPPAVLSVFLTGGRYSLELNAFLGEVALESYKRVKFDIAIFGQAGIDPAEGVFCHLEDEASFKHDIYQLPIKNRLVLSDYSKLPAESGGFRFLDPEELSNGAEQATVISALEWHLLHSSDQDLPSIADLTERRTERLAPWRANGGKLGPHAEWVKKWQSVRVLDAGYKFEFLEAKRVNRITLMQDFLLEPISGDQQQISDSEPLQGAHVEGAFIEVKIRGGLSLAQPDLPADLDPSDLVIERVFVPEYGPS